ncbi:hypothetical protein HNP84_006578 [Thermocatellispora tengchongensis]|uniref:Acetoacetate decarboxylase n=1 Tax=Thermocatellispora tengchongensis TaxID=1073253 RepID=A0A840PI86_9ACTN|nr:hypothetical protein [Thermocatellispora tengchongensis]MBB5136827.1 hypothetical protein [Thermocatellispora tengchongensis]
MTTQQAPKVTGGADTIKEIAEYAEFGTLDPGLLLDGAPQMPHLDVEPVTFERAEMIQVFAEIPMGSLQGLIPPALAPTNPSFVSWRGLHLPDTPWGPVTMAETRLVCRAGFRPRVFLVEGYIDNAEAAAEFARGWGFRLRVCDDVKLRRFHDETRLEVVAGGTRALAVRMVEPVPTNGGSFGLNANINFAVTPDGPKLVQAGADYVFHRADLGRPRIDAFEPSAWGRGGVVPVYPVSAVAGQADITFREIKFVSDPVRPALFGTTKIR